MIFKIVLFLTLIGLHDMYSHGKVCRIDFIAEQPDAYEMVGELLAGSSAKPKSRQKRDSVSSVNGLPSTQEMRGYLSTIEQYMPVIRENIDKIEKKFSANYPLGQHVQRHDNAPDSTFQSGLFGTRTIPNVESSWRYPNEPRLFSPRNEDDRNREKLTGDENREVISQTDLSGFSDVSNPGVNFERDIDERSESIREFENSEDTETDDISSNSNQNFMLSNAFEPGYDYFMGDVKSIENQRMRNLCEECGKPIRRYDSNKPLVININSDCSGQPNDRFSGFSLQSRAHCRPFKSNQPPHKSSKFCSFNCRQMPWCYCH